MMDCKDIERLDSAYIDDELDDQQTEAFRSHLRQCTECRQATRDLATMVDVASQLAPIDPPDRLWSAIRQQLQSAADVDAALDRGEARVTDPGTSSGRLSDPGSSRKSSRESGRASRWLPGWLTGRWRFASTLAIAAAACALLIWSLSSGSDRGQRSGEAGAPVAIDSTGPAPEASGQSSATPGGVRPTTGAHQTFSATVNEELQAADRQYSDTIAELRDMVDEDRDSWPVATRTAFETRMNQFEQAAERHRQALALASAPSVQAREVTTPGPRGRDELYAVYRAEIAFLQRVAIDGPPELPGLEGL